MLLKAADADRFIKDPTRSRLVLLYGPDPGGITDRANLIAKRLVGGDALAIIRIESDELASDPGRLADEAYGASLFAGRRVIRLRATGNKNIAPFLEPLFERPPEETWVLVEAGDLRKTAPLRKLFETSPGAVAIACYPDTDASIGRMIDEEMRTLGVTIETEARAELVSLLGADRVATRSEIQKLGLYALDAGTVTRATVVELIGDGASFGVDDVVEAAALGDPAGVDRGTRRLAAAGTAPSTIATAAERYFLSLHRQAAQIEAGQTIAGLIESMRPPPCPSRRALIERQLRLWTRPDLDAVLTKIYETVRDGRLQPGVGQGIVTDALLAIARRGRRLAQSRAAPD
jgi:DNA polymerase-3 subunit delta